MLTVLYFIVLGLGAYHLLYLQQYTDNVYVVGATIISAWLAGMQWGELVEKIQHVFHVSSLLKGRSH